MPAADEKRQISFRTHAANERSRNHFRPEPALFVFLPTAIFNNPVFQFHCPVADTRNILRTVRNEQHRAAAVFQSGDRIQYYFY